MISFRDALPQKQQQQQQQQPQEQQQEISFKNNKKRNMHATKRRSDSNIWSLSTFLVTKTKAEKGKTVASSQ